MDPTLTSLEHKPAETPRRKFPLKRLALAAPFLLALSVLAYLIVVSLLPVEKVVWVKPEAVKVAPPAPANWWSRLKDRIVVLPVIEPLWKRYHPAQPYINLTVRVYSFPDPPSALGGLGAPDGTNTSGLRVWILPRAAGDRLKNDAAASPNGATLLISIHTISGGSSTSMRLNSPFPTAVNAHVLPGALRVQSLQSPLTIELRPTAVAKGIQLTTRVTATETYQSANQDAASPRTKFNVGCQVTIPKAGTLVIDCGETQARDGRHFWLFVTPTNFGTNYLNYSQDFRGI